MEKNKKRKKRNFRVLVGYRALLVLFLPALLCFLGLGFLLLLWLWRRLRFRVLFLCHGLHLRQCIRLFASRQVFSEFPFFRLEAANPLTACLTAIWRKVSCMLRFKDADSLCFQWLLAIGSAALARERCRITLITVHADCNLIAVRPPSFGAAFILLHSSFSKIVWRLGTRPSAGMWRTGGSLQCISPFRGTQGHWIQCPIHCAGRSP